MQVIFRRLGKSLEDLSWRAASAKLGCVNRQRRYPDHTVVDVCQDNSTTKVGKKLLTEGGGKWIDILIE